MRKAMLSLVRSSVWMALALVAMLVVGGCQSLSQEGMAGKREQQQIMSQEGVGPEGQLPGQESFGNEPQLRPEGEGGWENPNQ